MTSAAPVTAPSGVVARLVASAPVLVPVVMALLALSGMVAVLLEVYSLPTVLVPTVVLSVVAIRVVGLGERTVTRRDLVFDVLALVLAGGFALGNAAYASQDVVIARDPGVYSVASQWLVDHDSLDIDGEPQNFGASTAFAVRSAGIGPVKQKGHLYAQGAHVVPAVLGVAGRVFGTNVMFRTNCLIGGLALLAVYGFARRLIGRPGALLAATVLGVGLPQIAFSRDNYTEAFSQLCVYGGLALLWQARRGQWGVWFLSGLVLAGSCLARIDALLALPALAAYGGLRMAESPRREVVRDVLALWVGAAIPTVLGWQDLKRLAPGYYHKLSPEYHQLVVLTLFTVVLAGVLVLLARTAPGRWWDERRDVLGARLGNGVAAVVVLAGLVLASRPLWWQAKGDGHPGTNAYMAQLQELAGQPIDPDRRYFESSVTWLSWYLSPVCVALALVGLALLLRRVLKDRELELVPFVLAVGAAGGLYLVSPNIVPDQIWVMRRFMPVVLPGVAILGAGVLGLLLLHLRGRARQVGAVVGVAAFLLPVLNVSRPFLFVREYTPQLLEVQRICKALPDNAAVVVTGEMSRIYPMTIRTFCGVPASGTPDLSSDLARPAREAAAKQGRQLWVVADEDVQETVDRAIWEFPVPASTVIYKQWRPTLTTPPKRLDTRLRRLFIGQVAASGYVEHWVAAE